MNLTNFPPGQSAIPSGQIIDGTGKEILNRAAAGQSSYGGIGGGNYATCISIVRLIQFSVHIKPRLAILIGPNHVVPGIIEYAPGAVAAIDWSPANRRIITDRHSHQR